MVTDSWDDEIQNRCDPLSREKFNSSMNSLIIKGLCGNVRFILHPRININVSLSRLDYRRSKIVMIIQDASQ